MHIKEKLRRLFYCARLHLEINIALCGVALVIDDTETYFYVSFWNNRFRFGFEFDYCVSLWFTLYYGKYDFDNDKGHKWTVMLWEDKEKEKDVKEFYERLQKMSGTYDDED